MSEIKTLDWGLPIRSEADYQTALFRIDRLWGADPATKEGQALDALVSAVEEWERVR